jgi:hypothetical protein
MDVRGGSGVNRMASRPVTTLLYVVAVLVIFLSTCSPASALPAFARKYGMPCSSCHEAWPMLSPFGQQFKDNGYQMGNDRDAPIFQSPAYWPVTFRMTPYWHRESTDKAAVDQTASGEAQVTTHGFDWSGLDFHTAGTLANNYSFYVLPSSDNTGAFHFESVWGRVDNIGGSSWLNIKFGKFELDNLLSEKRILTLSQVGGFYENYHFQPFITQGLRESSYTFGIGDNQDGIEWMGHSKNDRTRISAALISDTDGQPGLPTNRGYGGFFAASQAFQLGSLGLQRVGGFAYIGQQPTYFQYSTGGAPIPGTGIGNQRIYRVGLIGQWYLRKFDITTMYFHSGDNATLASTTTLGTTAPAPPSTTGARAPIWNGGLFESHYNFSPQLILINRYELVRMSQQVFTANPGNLGNTDTLTFGLRYYPFISSRAGFAYHAEYAISRIRGGAPVTFTDVTSSSLLGGIDFDF